jgi:hypothetical protein
MSSDPQKNVWRVNRQPRFTVLELGEYMAAEDGPRETIIRNMKYERLVPSLMYRTLNQAVSSYLVSPTRDPRILARCRETLQAEVAAATNPRRRDNFAYELSALDAFERSVNKLGISGINFERAAASGHPISIEGVTVSVRPTAHVRQKRSRGADLVGALVIDVAKGSSPKTDEAKAKVTNAMVHSAIVLHQYVNDTLGEDGVKPSPEHTIIFHAHRQERVCAPDGYRKTLRNIHAVCRNIAATWERVTPPESFDPKRAQYRG